MHRHAWPMNRAKVHYFRYVTWATNVKLKGLIEQRWMVLEACV